MLRGALGGAVHGINYYPTRKVLGATSSPPDGRFRVG